MAYTLQQAADATGKVKSTIFKACKNGKVSYSKDENGHFLIEPAELHRVFPPVSGNDKISAEGDTEKTIGNAEFNAGNSSENRLLEQELRFLRERLADVERLKDQDRQALNDRIEELRRDRDDLRGERDKLLKVIEEQAGSVKLLTDQRGQDRQQVSAAGVGQGAEDRGQRGFFGRLFGGRKAS